MIYRTPQRVRLAADLHKTSSKYQRHWLTRHITSDLRLRILLTKKTPKAIDPEANAFAADFYAALVQKVLDAAER